MRNFLQLSQQPPPPNNSTTTKNSQQQQQHKIENEIDLITSSISKQSRLHYTTNNKYLNLRRLNSNRIEKLNSFLYENSENTTTTTNHDLIPNGQHSIQILSSHSENNMNKENVPKKSLDLLHSFNLIESNIQNKLNFHSKNIFRQAHKIHQINESNLDLNLSIVDQLLDNKAHHQKPVIKTEYTYSKIDYYMNKKINENPATKKTLPKIQNPNQNKPNPLLQKLSILEYISATRCYYSIS